MKDVKKHFQLNKGCFGLFGCLTLFLVVVVLVVAVLYGGLLSFFGFEYDSIYSIVQFVMALIIGTAIIEGIVFVFRVALSMILGLTTKQAKFIGILLELVGAFGLVQLLDNWMDSVSVPSSTAFFFAFCLFVFEVLLLTSEEK